MMNRHTKGRLLVFLTLIALLSACGGSPTTKTSTTATALPETSGLAAADIHSPYLTTTPLSPTPAGTPTPTPTPMPTPTPTPSLVLQNSPAGGGRFTTLPPGSALPTDAQCAASVARSSWEPRPENATANNTNFYAQGFRLTGSSLAQYGYQQRVTGNFTGTTDEILQWAACKWGIDEDVVRAQATVESAWRQSTLGDCNAGNTVSQTNGCQSVGIVQVKAANIPATYAGAWPYVYESTAFNVDFAYAVWRACYEGQETWLGNGYHAGDVWGCVGRWFSGDWYQSSQYYISTVQSMEANKSWLQPGF